MATIVERFKDALDVGEISAEGRTISLSPQMKYDYMAAVHTMEEVLSLQAEINKRKKKRTELRTKISNSCRLSLKKIVEGSELLTIKQIDSAIKGLQECRNELFKIETAEHESGKLEKIIEDGVSAGR